ncbi:MAG: hypothetical protein IH968_05865 [Gemmatimonadetes bacterium]|nr:hypothetical protein [Gemmatimonadota bacterium]
MTLDEAEFREAVNRSATDVDVSHRVRAAEVILRVLRSREAEPRTQDVEETVELAREFARMPSAEVRPLPPTAYSQETARLWLKLLEPWAKEFRGTELGHLSLPFSPTAWGDASAWISEQIGHLEDRGSLNVDEHAELRRELGAVASKIGLAVGGSVGHNPLSRPFNYYSPDGSKIEERWIRGYPTDVSWRGLVPPVITLANLSTHLKEMSGFSQPDLVRYLLCDVPLEFPRVLVKGHTRFFQLPDGTDISGSRVVVEFLTPDVTWDALQGLHKDIRKMWSRLGEGIAPSRAQRPRLTTLDRKLAEVVHSLGGAPEQLSRGWWEQVAEEWGRRGHRPRSLDAHRKHWMRLQEKSGKPGVLPGDRDLRTHLP